MEGKIMARRQTKQARAQNSWRGDKKSWRGQEMCHRDDQNNIIPIHYFNKMTPKNQDSGETRTCWGDIQRIMLVAHLTMG
jgi:hypothetical protein